MKTPTVDLVVTSLCLFEAGKYALSLIACLYANLLMQFSCPVVKRYSSTRIKFPVATVLMILLCLCALQWMLIKTMKHTGVALSSTVLQQTQSLAT